MFSAQNKNQDSCIKHLQNSTIALFPHILVSLTKLNDFTIDPFSNEVHILALRHTCTAGTNNVTNVLHVYKKHDFYYNYIYCRISRVVFKIRLKISEYTESFCVLASNKSPFFLELKSHCR